MKHLIVSDKLHSRLKIKAIHSQRKLEEVTDEILSSHFDTQTTPTKEK